MFLAGLLLESLRLPWALEKAMHQFCDDDGDCAEYVHAADYVYDDGREPRCILWMLSMLVGNLCRMSTHSGFRFLLNPASCFASPAGWKQKQEDAKKRIEHKTKMKARVCAAAAL